MASHQFCGLPTELANFQVSVPSLDCRATERACARTQLPLQPSQRPQGIHLCTAVRAGLL